MLIKVSGEHVNLVDPPFSNNQNSERAIERKDTMIGSGSFFTRVPGGSHKRDVTLQDYPVWIYKQIDR